MDAILKLLLAYFLPRLVSKSQAQEIRGTDTVKCHLSEDKFSQYERESTYFRTLFKGRGGLGLLNFTFSFMLMFE